MATIVAFRSRKVGNGSCSITDLMHALRISVSFRGVHLILSLVFLDRLSVVP